MSALPDDDESFLRFARRHDPTITGGSFVPRRLYGEYLAHLLDEAAASAPRGASLERVVGAVVDVEPLADGARLTLDDGRALRADHVVLALGNYAPADPRIADPSFFESPRYVRDPWAPGAFEGVPKENPVLLIGTSLTMFDAALSLRARGVVGTLFAISRRGLLPQPHRSHGAPPTFAHYPPGLATAPRTARGYLRAVREHVDAMAKEGIDWREVVTALRPRTPELWGLLSVKERARFLRHVRSYWEVLRHRAAPAPAAAIAAEIEAKKLIVMAGRVVSLVDRGDRVSATVRPRRSDATTTLEVSTVINCTGPESDTRTLAEPLVLSMRRRGLWAADPLGLGVMTSEDGALLDGKGRPSSVLHYVGPFLKAQRWEATAVPELRVHARALADKLIAAMAETSRHQG